jgi:hypothetical protein
MRLSDRLSRSSSQLLGPVGQASRKSGKSDRKECQILMWSKKNLSRREVSVHIHLSVRRGSMVPTGPASV